MPLTRTAFEAAGAPSLEFKLECRGLALDIPAICGVGTMIFGQASTCNLNSFGGYIL
jgi:hypothetical protein